MPDDSPLQITSETGRLRRVIVHTPGREMALVDPARRLDMLFDDILCVETARTEHLRMCALFRRLFGADDVALELADLLLEALAVDQARHELVEQLCAMGEQLNLRPFEQELERLAPAELQQFALTGELPLGLHLPPLPNLMFTRDLAAVVGDAVIVSYPATAARARESLLIEVVLRHHPALAAAAPRIVELPPGVTFEGGDLLVASDEVVLIGLSERTSFGAVMTIAGELFARTSVRQVVMVDLPKQRSCMHLDTVFTFAGPDECVVFPPLFTDEDRANSFLITPGDAPGQVRCENRPRFRRLLEEALERELRFIPCGGADPLDQRREQWTDGANFFALAPHVVLGYQRNHRTFDQMREHGYAVLDAADLLDDARQGAPLPPGKLAIRLEGTELSRGRGGPRCMTLPLARLPESAGDQRG